MSSDGAQRRLAAILSADVAGYSRLMAADEEATVRTLTAYRDQIGALIREHRGRVVDAPGDNLLAEFSTATDAVEAAVEIQRVIQARNAGLDAARKMEFRIGVHLGEVRVEGDRIYGDGVNIAARLEGLAQAGGICVSAAVRDQVARRLGLDFEDLGEQSVKNLPDPVHVYRVLERGAGAAGAAPAVDRAAGATPALHSADGAAPSRRRFARPVVVASAAAIGALAIAAMVYRGITSSRSAENASEANDSGPPLTAIAVLPFDDLSPGGDHAWLANGMAEELIEMLARSEALQVVARTSAHVAKERGGDIPGIGKLLNVGSVVVGSVRRSDQQLRVIVQLIRVADGLALWTGRYEDRKLDDVFAIQEEIGREVAEALRSELGVASDTYSPLRLARYLPKDVRAYELVKKGVDLSRPFWYQEESVRRAIGCYREALEIDPSYAQAHAQLGLSYYSLWFWRHDFNEETREQARAAALRALELEPTNGTAHNLLAGLSFDDGDWESAKARFESALDVTPSDGELRFGYGYLLLGIGSGDEAAVQMQTAAELDPQSGLARFGVGEVLLAQRQYEAAIAVYQRGAELGDIACFGALPLALHLDGKDAEALEAWIRFAARYLATGDLEEMLRRAYENHRLEGATTTAFEAMVSRFDAACTTSPWYGARMLDLIGDPDRMFECLERSIAEHQIERVAKVHPIYDPYRDDPRFEAYLRRVHLAD